MSHKESGYLPPESCEELIKRYQNGERNFPETELSNADLSGVVLDGAFFEKFSWFFDSNFEGASLCGTSFRECNVKCASFKNADLTGAIFELASIESINLEGAIVTDASFIGATFYGYTLSAEDKFP